MTLTRIFVLKRKFAYPGGGTSSVFGRHKPRNALQWHRACYFILGHNLCLGSAILAWGGHKQWYGGHSPEMSPYGARPALYISASSIVMQLSRRVLQQYHTLKNYEWNEGKIFADLKI